MTDEDVDRDPETEASIQERREFLAELAEGYRRAKELLLRNRTSIP